MHGTPSRHDSEHEIATSLQLEQDPEADAREWRYERIGWAVLALVLITGLTGVLGDGWLARVNRTTPDGAVQGEIERVVRNGTGMEILLRFPAGARVGAQHDTVIVRVSQAFLRHAALDKVVPEPVGTAASDLWLELAIERSDPSRVMPVSITATPHVNGPTHLTIQTTHGAIDAGVFVLP